MSEQQDKKQFHVPAGAMCRKCIAERFYIINTPFAQLMAVYCRHRSFGGLLSGDPKRWLCYGPAPFDEWAGQANAVLHIQAKVHGFDPEKLWPNGKCLQIKQT